MTVLSNLKDDDWNESIFENIKEFLTNKKIKILIIYLNEKNTLTSDFYFPSYPVGELTYFIRKRNEEFCVKNFHNEILFGTTNNTNVEATLSAITNDLLAPIFLNTYSWSDSILFD